MYPSHNHIRCRNTYINPKIDCKVEGHNKINEKDQLIWQKTNLGKNTNKSYGCSRAYCETKVAVYWPCSAINRQQMIRKILEWWPRNSTPSRGRPLTSWTDVVKRHERNWLKIIKPLIFIFSEICLNWFMVNKYRIYKLVNVIITILVNIHINSTQLLF